LKGVVRAPFCWQYMMGLLIDFVSITDFLYFVQKGLEILLSRLCPSDEHLLIAQPPFLEDFEFHSRFIRFKIILVFFFLMNSCHMNLISLSRFSILRERKRKLEVLIPTLVVLCLVFPTVANSALLFPDHLFIKTSQGPVQCYTQLDYMASFV